MRLRLRLLFLVITSLWRRPMGVTDESVLAFRVLPNDVDVTRITNDRFIALMDLGRMDAAFRVGLLGVMFRRRWVPVATFDTIRFRYPLKLFQRYLLRTRVVWWDETTFYFQQIFERKGRPVATGYVCATALGPSGPIPPHEVIEAARHAPELPPQPAIVPRLREMERLIRDTQRGSDTVPASMATGQ